MDKLDADSIHNICLSILDTIDDYEASPNLTLLGLLDALAFKTVCIQDSISDELSKEEFPENMIKGLKHMIKTYQEDPESMNRKLDS